MDSLLKDPALAPDGRKKIEFARKRMPVLDAVTDELAATRPLDGMRVAACLHVTTETANLCRALVARGGRGGGLRLQPAVHQGRRRSRHRR